MRNLGSEEIKCRLKTGNSCYYSVQTLLSSRLLSKNLKIKIYKTIILPVVLYGCETWSLPLREECRLRVFENRILRRIFGPKRDENGKWRKFHRHSKNRFIRHHRLHKIVWLNNIDFVKSFILTTSISRFKESSAAIYRPVFFTINLPLFSTVFPSNSCCLMERRWKIKVN